MAIIELNGGRGVIFRARKITNSLKYFFLNWYYPKELIAIKMTKKK